MFSVTVQALVGDDVGPERLDVLGLEDAAPRRHLVLAARDCAHEALALVVRKLAQVECALRILHARAVARRAIALVEVGAALDRLRRRCLRECRAARQHHCGKSAKVHTEPPGGTRSFSASRLMFQYSPPIPESTVTYCLP